MRNVPFMAVEAKQKYGQLTALRSWPSVARRRKWLCQCDCGQQCIKRADHLMSGNTKSCGCLWDTSPKLKAARVANARHQKQKWANHVHAEPKRPEKVKPQVYKIVNRLDGRVYVGKTCYPLDLRIRQHITTQSNIGVALAADGPHNFEVTRLETVDTNQEALLLERFWTNLLEAWDPRFGYNHPRATPAEKRYIPVRLRSLRVRAVEAAAVLGLRKISLDIIMNNAS